MVRSADVGEKPGYLTPTKDGACLDFARPFGDTVSVLDTETLTVVDSITVGKGPSVVTTPNGLTVNLAVARRGRCHSGVASGRLDPAPTPAARPARRRWSRCR